MAIIADGGRAIVVIYREGVEINYFLLYFIDSDKNPLTAASSNPLRRGSHRWGMFLHHFNKGLVQPLPRRLPGVGYARPSKLCRWRGKQLHHGGDVSVLPCLASKKSSERVFLLPPERT